MKLKNLFLILFFAAFLIPAPLFAQQAPIFFDAFLFDNAGQPADNFNAFIQWDVTDGSVDLVGGNVPGAPDQVNGRFVELGGSTGDPGRFATRLSFPFAPGTVYNLRFDYKSSDGNLNAGQVNVGGQIFNFSTASTDLQLFSRSFTFSALTTAPLVFQDLGNDNDGIGIDNVVLSIAVVTAAPVEVGGRIITSDGSAIRNAFISLTDNLGNVRSTVSSSFGFYRFADLPAGQTYVLTVRAKGYSFPQSPQVLTVAEAVADNNFVAEQTELKSRR